MAILKADARQTVWDLSLQGYGSVEGVFSLLADNGNEFDLDKQFAQDEIVKVVSSPKDKFTKEFFANQISKPVSKLAANEGRRVQFNLSFSTSFSQ